ncbi:response regulator [Candidatus Bipolaricaulota bacterium]|nr:response regulator [Candidatus Bipolaricaulota bacterium]
MPSGEEGVRTFREAQQGDRPFELVITDLGMPEMDGREVARRVKALESGVPVLLLTGWGTAPPEGGIPGEVDLTLAKPPRVEELRRALWELTTGEG